MFGIVRGGLSKHNSGLLSAIDIGSSKVSCCIARSTYDGTLNVIGVGQYASKGIRNGSIVDMHALEMAIRGAVHDAEKSAGEMINNAFISISPNLINSSQIVLDTNIDGHAVDDADIRKILLQASHSAGKSGYEIIYSVPFAYSIDNAHGIRDPRGMYGHALQSNVLVLAVHQSPLRNLHACIERCHLTINGIVASPYASGLATLVDDEMDLGVTLIDMGAGSTAIAMFVDGCLNHIDHVAIGGAHVTNDLARGLSTPLNHAERIKTFYGSAMVAPLDSRELIAAPQIGEDPYAKGTQITKAEITRIIRPRIEETLELVRDCLKKNNADHITGKRVVLTGGASQLAGVRELASMILDRQVRIGRPLKIVSSMSDERIKSPAFATCAGLLEYARGEQLHNFYEQNNETNLLSRVGKIGHWIRENI